MAEAEPQEEENLLKLVTTSLTSAHTFLSRNELLVSPELSLYLETLLSAAAASLRRLSLPLPLSPPQTPQLSFFTRLLSSPSSPLWPQSLRLSHPSFLLLLRLLPPSLAPSSLAAALFRLAHSSPYSSLSRRFSLPSPSAAASSFFSACKALSDSLRFPPISSSDAAAAAAAAPSPFLLPNCLGSLGLLRIRVRNSPGILVQALVDPAGRFLDVSAGWPASLTPAAVLRQTSLYLSLEDSSGEDSSPSPPSPPRYYFVGNSCLPLLPWLLTPYRNLSNDDADGEPKRVFNAAHKEASRVAGAALRRLRRRWRILDRVWGEESVEYLPFVVVTCCLLHNFAEECREPIMDRDRKEDWGWNEEEEEEQEQEFSVFEGEASESGRRVRDTVAVHLAEVCSEKSLRLSMP